jgi:hypothetical protein
MRPRRSDYSGLPLMKAITSASDDEIHQLTHFWVYGSASVDGGTFPFLFINGGVATLSGSALGAAIVRDTITQREIQLLEHTSIRYSHFHIAFPDPHISNRRPPHLCDGMSRFYLRMQAYSLFPSAKAYHVSDNRYSIATADCGVNATVKIWTARRSSSRPRGRRVSGGFGRW